MSNTTRIGSLFAALLIWAVPLATAQTLPQIGSSISGAGQSGGATTGTSKTSGSGLLAVPEDFSKLKIAPGFLLSVQVYDVPELSGEHRVDDAGNIAFPLAGLIHVGESTLDEARQRIEAKLISAQVLLHPQISINIEQYAPFIVAVMGEVQSPGRVQLLAPHSLLDVMSQVGGMTALAGGVVQVRHTVGEQTTTESYRYGRNSNGSSIANVIIREGDTVIVPRAGIVYVFGAVMRPGGYLMQEDGSLDVAQAISLAQGLTLQAGVRSIRVARRNADGSFVEYPINYKAISEGKEIPMHLQAQDMVYVPLSKLKTVLTNGAALMAEAASLTIYTVK